MTIKIVVPVSGGKDSQACLKLAVKEFGTEEVRGLFCDTQFEHPLTYAHVDKLRALYGNVQIDAVSGGSALEKTLKYKRFPGGGARHCTEELKMREAKLYYRALALAQGGFEVWLGMRSGESSARAKRYADVTETDLREPHAVFPNKFPKYLAAMGVMFRLPILDWAEDDVFDYLDGEESPLYGFGFPRVGCFPCLASGDKWKEKAFTFDDFGRSQLAKVQLMETQIGHSVWKSKTNLEKYPINEAEDQSGCAICAI